MVAIMAREQQLALPVQLPDHALFSNFVASGNEPAYAHLKRLAHAKWQAQEQFTLLFGGAGRGKTHLLCALCESFANAGKSSIYLPLAELTKPSATSILNGIEQYDFIALDDLDAVVAIPEWAEALFILINRLLDKRAGHLAFAAGKSQQRLPIALADLRSRLQLAVTFQLHELNDAGKVKALQQHAQERGLELSVEVGDYMMQRLSRDMHQLMAVLEKLDEASMAQQRRLTLPFIKQILQV